MKLRERLMPKKRGRPVGVKNKEKHPIDDFKKALDEWDKMEAQVNWEDIAKKQETKLKVYIQENEQIAKIAKDRWTEICQLRYLVSYLESRVEDLTIRSR